MNGKNLVIIHLESLSNNFYYFNKSLFPNLKKIEDRCISYNNYFSTATSTLMVWEDLQYGNTLQYEQCKKVKDEPPFYRKTSSMFDCLKECGYRTKAISFPRMDTIEYINKKHIFGFNNHMDATKDYHDFLKYIENTLEGQKPFALFAANIISHVSYNEKIKIKDNLSTERWREGYRYIDQTVGEVFELLEKKGILDNTIVIMYGDHGDDFWEHSLHDGYTHGIEPYTNIINTPLMIFDTVLKKQEIEDIVITKDLYDIIFNLLDIKARNSILIYDLFRSKRKHAFSRNLYANQDCNIFSFNKSYTILDKEYCLLVSQKGLEMYAYRQDSCNHNNLLKFFVLNNKKELIYNKAFNSLHSWHYRDYMNHEKKEKIIKEYYKLKKLLYNYLVKQYYIVGNQNLLGEMKFNKINRIYSDRCLNVFIHSIITSNH